MYRIESFLSARLFLAPQIHNQVIYFVSNLSGKLSLYSMRPGGSVPTPLIPPHIALQNPDLVGYLYQVFPDLGKILIMLDQDGNEDYKPMFIPLDGGYPTPAFEEGFVDHRFFLQRTDLEKGIAYFTAASHKEPLNILYKFDLSSGSLTPLYQSVYGGGVGAVNETHEKMIIMEGYTVGDVAGWFFDARTKEMKLLFGKPINDRQPGEEVPLTGMGGGYFIENDQALMLFSTIYDDAGGLLRIPLDNPAQISPIAITGKKHTGIGEFGGITHLYENHYTAQFNIDGSDWVYEAEYLPAEQTLQLNDVIVGDKKPLANGVMSHLDYEKNSKTFILSYSTATSPTQIFTIGEKPPHIQQHTSEKLLGIPEELLSPGEDKSFISFDGLRVSARLYLPAPEMGFQAPFPLVYYIHGGPQSQERPDFAWFSMPLIQFLTLNGFAVFVPNVRGSTGYGLKYTKYVDHDWGGQDRLDHVYAMKEVLSKDPRIDTTRAAVVGRSYGGYMTLTLAARHSELWKASCDMFGPFDLLSFMDRIPATWKPYFVIALGDPEKDRDFLIERSPKTHIDHIAAPMLVIQGKNDPRVVEQESHDLVEYLRSTGKQVDYLVFENEGHDVLKYENRVTCYNTITNFFKTHLQGNP